MRRFIVLFVLLTGSLALAQYTNVTATVTDPNAIPYASAQVNISFVNTSGSPQAPVFTGTSTGFPSTFSTTTDSTGAFAIRLPDNALITPSGTQWRFQISIGTIGFTSTQTVTGTSQSLSTAISADATTLPVSTFNIMYFKLKAAGGNPPTGYIGLYGDSGTGNLTCLTSTGGACISGGGGAGATFQVNGVNTANQATINFLDSAATNGLTVGFTNPSVGQVKLTLSGTLANAGLANSSVTVNTSAPLGGGGAVSLGGNLTVTCTTCATSANNLSFFALTTSAQFAGVISDATGAQKVVLSDSPTFTTRITTPVLISGAADPADAGVIRMGNAELIGWEASPAGTDVTVTVDSSGGMQSSGTFNAVTLTESGNAGPNSTDKLSFFASTTSAELFGVISNKTGGSGVLVGNNTPSITTPIISNTVVGSLGAGTSLGKVAVVTDGVDKTDCTVGGGTTIVWCIATGSTWTSAAAAAGGAGANAALSNLASVAINTALVPGSDNAIDVGSNSLKMRTGYFGTSVISPSFQSSGSNGGIDALEGTGGGLTPATSHDLLYPDSTAHRWKVNNNNAGADTLALFTDKLSVFAATSSAELAGVISDETGSGKLTFATAPTFLTSITTPVIISAAADHADAGAVRLGNAETIAWEDATPGTDLTITMNSSNVFTVSTPISATTGFQIGGAATSNHCLLGNGTDYVDSASCLISGGALGTPSSATLTNATGLPGSGLTNASVTATQLAAQYSKGQCVEAWGGS